MKKFLILTLAFIQTLSMCYAADEIVLDLSNTSSNTSVAIVEPEKKLFSDIEKKDIVEESYKNDTSSLGTITLFTLNFFNKTAFCIKILSFSSITPSSFIVFTISTNSSLVAVTL